MKNFIMMMLPMILLFGSVASQTLEPFTCPDNNNGFYELPECGDTCCSSYYVCNQGIAYIASCTTPGFVFNPSTSSCVDPVDCTKIPFQCPPGANGFFPDQDCLKTECCAAYQVCVDGVNYPATCQGSTVFDVADATCVEPAACFVCPSANSNGNFADPDCPAGTCCTDYKLCTNGTPSNAICPAGQVFDAANGRCARPGSGGTAC